MLLTAPALADETPSVDFTVSVGSDGGAHTSINVSPTGGAVPTKSKWSCRYAAPRMDAESSEIAVVCRFGKKEDGTSMDVLTMATCPFGKRAVSSMQVADAKSRDVIIVTCFDPRRRP
jgi:hypothetical protein